MDGTVNRAESLKAQIGGGPETEILADSTREAVPFDLVIDLIVGIGVDKRFPPIGANGIWILNSHHQCAL